MNAYCCVGMKYGDLASILPMLCEQHRVSGVKPILVTSKKYADLPQDCPSVEVDIFDGEWQDLKGGLAYAKSKYRNVINLSTFGRDFTIEHKLPGFQLDQWQRGGMLDKFGKLSMVLNGKGTEAPKKERTIGVITSSESSPFPKSKELLDAIVYSNCRAEVLDDRRLGRISELIYDMERYSAIVTIDTAALHISAASRVPVLAFVTDKPEMWHGSSYQPRLRFHCRYSDFDKRKAEFVKALKDAVEGNSRPKYWDIDRIYPNAYNPSIIEDGDKILMSYRYHPEATAQSQLAIAELDASFKVKRNFPLVLPDSLKGNFSVEDGRLFRFGGKLHISYTVARLPMPPFKCVVGYGRIEKVDGQWKLLEDIRVKYGKNDLSSLEKNWVFMESGGKLYFNYGKSPQVICEVQGDKVVSEHKSDIPAGWNYGTLHAGTTPIPYKGKLLRFFHSRTDDGQKPWWWHYRIGACLMEPKPPFKIISINENPIISGDEEYRQNTFWKPKICFPAGVIHRGDKFYLSVGHNDSACRIYELEERHLGL